MRCAIERDNEPQAEESTKERLKAQMRESACKEGNVSEREKHARDGENKRQSSKVKEGDGE